MAVALPVYAPEGKGNPAGLRFRARGLVHGLQAVPGHPIPPVGAAQRSQISGGAEAGAGHH